MEYFKVTENDKENIKKLSRFATEIVRDPYDPIVGENQNDYMLEMFQSEAAITKQLNSGYDYTVAMDNGKWIGFYGVEAHGEKLFLSKFYVHKDSRKKGYSSAMMKKIIDECKDRGLSSVYLRVNRENSDSIEVYKHFGFIIDCEDKADIGNGYFMDDYIMEYTL